MQIRPQYQSKSELNKGLQWNFPKGKAEDQLAIDMIVVFPQRNHVSNHNINIPGMGICKNADPLKNHLSLDELSKEQNKGR